VAVDRSRNGAGQSSKSKGDDGEGLHFGSWGREMS
jgi:hypothetical protein